jgi:hypothetical protein
MGMPGMVANSPKATVTSAGSWSSVRIRIVSCESTKVRAWAVARHGCAAANDRIAVVIAPPGKRGMAVNGPGWNGTGPGATR